MLHVIQRLPKSENGPAYWLPMVYYVYVEQWDMYKGPFLKMIDIVFIYSHRYDGSQEEIPSYLYKYLKGVKYE